MTVPLSKASESYKNFIAIGDFNIDVTNKGTGFDEFCDLFNLTNLVTSRTYLPKLMSQQLI